MIRTALVTALALAMSGCVSTLSGVGGTQSYACQAPVGALCTSVSGVYANALHGMSEVPHPPAKAPPPGLLGAYAIGVTPPALETAPLPQSPIENQSLTVSSAASAPTLAPASDIDRLDTDTSLRSAPRILRLWIAPWEDSDGDLHDAATVHVVVDTGRWLIEHVRPAPRDRLEQVTVPTGPPPTTPPSSDPPPPSIPQEPTGVESLPAPGVSSTAP